MTDYGVMARRHWARWLPRRFAGIADPEVFFAELGREVSREIEDLAVELEGPDPVGESYLQRVGRMNTARSRARELVLAERVLLSPEPGTDPPETPDPRPSGRWPEPVSRAGELPVTVAPGDPLWAEITDEEARARATLRRGRSGR